MIPSDGTLLVLGTSCNYVSTNALSSSLPDPQMLFSFIPSESSFSNRFFWIDRQAMVLFPETCSACIFERCFFGRIVKDQVSWMTSLPCYVSRETECVECNRTAKSENRFPKEGYQHSAIYVQWSCKNLKTFNKRSLERFFHQMWRGSNWMKRSGAWNTMKTMALNGMMLNVMWLCSNLLPSNGLLYYTCSHYIVLT